MLLLASAAPASSAASPVPSAASWAPLAPGAEHLHVDDGNLDLFRFDLTRFRADVAVPGAGGPMTAAELRRESGAGLVVNGGFFDTNGRSLGLRVASGRQIIKLRAAVDWGVLVIRDGRADIVHSRDFAAAAAAPNSPVTAAIQVGPRILVDGQPPTLKPQAARRTAVALDQSGRFLTIVVARARMEAGALARVLERLGFHHALMLDGGPSTQLSAQLGAFNLEIAGGYAVPDLLLIRPRS
jgi:exopolysaccharide biosynthesis protein